MSLLPPTFDDYARLQLQKLIGIACVQRKRSDGALIDDRSQLRGCGIDDRRFGTHVHHFLLLAKLHGLVQRHHLVQA